MDREKTLTYIELLRLQSENPFDQEVDLINNNVQLLSIIDALPYCILILNHKRQIIASNKSAINSLSITDIQEILGLRIGYAVKCIRRDEEPGGCGTSKFCKQCGANKATSLSLAREENTVEEWLITTEMNDRHISHNYSIHSSILELDNNKFLLVALQDISAQKRIELLERMFFHDALNTSGALYGLATLLKQVDNEKDRIEITDTIIESSKQLIEEIKSQRDLVSAEQGKLEVKFAKVSIKDILKSVYDLYIKGELAESKNFVLDIPQDNVKIVTDSTLLIRSLGNLVKNALEASVAGNTVRLFSEIEATTLKLSVYNEKVIDESIAVQIFQRSFSTKNGLGRGIGTYGVKLLVEQFLKGSVYFKSAPRFGTLFTIELPL